MQLLQSKSSKGDAFVSSSALDLALEFPGIF